MKITICYLTARREPMFEWFVNSLISQYPNSEVQDEIIIIDLFLDYDTNNQRRNSLEKLINNRFEYLHIPPKPSIWLGKHRKTKRNFFDASGTRNTGFIVCNTEYIVFVDDLSVLMPGWLSYHKWAAENKLIFAGAYNKVSDIVFENNVFKSYKGSDIDCRLTSQLTNESISIGGGWIFGANSGFPMEYIEKVNGYDEYLARRGCEDCNIGVRLENAGYKSKMFYNKNCLIIEDDYLHGNGPNEVDELYAVRQWGSDFNNLVKNNICKDALNKIEFDHLYVKKEYWTIDRNFDLKTEKLLYQNTGEFKSVENVNFIDFDGETLDQL